MQKRNELRNYYTRLFPRVIETLVRMVTLNYRFDLWRVELVPRWEIPGGGTPMNRDLPAL